MVSVCISADVEPVNRQIHKYTEIHLKLDLVLSSFEASEITLGSTLNVNIIFDGSSLQSLDLFGTGGSFTK